MTIFSCGCENETDVVSGVLRSITKCSRHRKDMQSPYDLGEKYYTDLGVLKDGALVSTAYVEELVEALGPIEQPRRNTTALEVGCGISPYVPAIQHAGWTYTGVDASKWAADWTSRKWNVSVTRGDWETMIWYRPTVGMILAAHCLEHMSYAPEALALMAEYIIPGGVLYLIVPDDSDPTNPDHLWFFDINTLRACVESTGLLVERLVLRRIVKRENFLYCRARKL